MFCLVFCLYFQGLPWNCCPHKAVVRPLLDIKTCSAHSNPETKNSEKRIERKTTKLIITSYLVISSFAPSKTSFPSHNKRFCFFKQRGRAISVRVRPEFLHEIRFDNVRAWILLRCVNLHDLKIHQVEFVNLLWSYLLNWRWNISPLFL